MVLLLNRNALRKNRVGHHIFSGAGWLARSVVVGCVVGGRLAELAILCEDVFEEAGDVRAQRVWLVLGHLAVHIVKIFAGLVSDQPLSLLGWGHFCGFYKVDGLRLPGQKLYIPSLLDHLHLLVHFLDVLYKTLS